MVAGGQEFKGNVCDFIVSFVTELCWLGQIVVLCLEATP